MKYFLYTMYALTLMAALAMTIFNTVVFKSQQKTIDQLRAAQKVYNCPMLNYQDYTFEDVEN